MAILNKDYEILSVGKGFTVKQRRGLLEESFESFQEKCAEINIIITDDEQVLSYEDSAKVYQHYGYKVTYLTEEDEDAAEAAYAAKITPEYVAELEAKEKARLEQWIKDNPNARFAPGFNLDDASQEKRLRKEYLE